MSELDKYLIKCVEKGWRCLVIVIGENDLSLNSIGENTLCISKYADKTMFEKYNVPCSRTVNFAEAHKLLGTEFDNVVLSLYGATGWPGNLLALSTEYVNKGGYYILLIPEKLLETPFGKYFYNIVIKSENHVLIMNNKIVSHRYKKEKPIEPPPPTVASSDKYIKKLAKLAKNNEQAKALKILPTFLYSRKYKMLLLHGDRGRGKSSILGLYGAYILARNNGIFIITSRNLESIQSFYKMLTKGLDALGINYVVTYEKNGLITSVSTGKSTIKYVKPWKVTETKHNKPLLVDEAAGVGVARVRRWYNKIGKIMASTTIHGYEGSGRVLLKYIEELMKKTMTVKLRLPIRYYPNDPLEKTLYRLFHLDAEPPEINYEEIKNYELKYIEISVDELINNYELLRKTYGLLVTAHYRNEPDDLVLLLDTNVFKIRALTIKDHVIGVAQIRPEKLDESEKNILNKLLERLGVVQYHKPRKHELWRIVRIAITPPLQRKGYGSILLKNIEDEAKRNNIDSVGAIFSGFQTINFWLKNDYYPIYISPRYNKVTGEKNVAVIKPLNKSSENIVLAAATTLYQKTRYTSHILFRDLGIEKIDSINSFLEQKGINNSPQGLDCIRLRRYIEDLNEYYEAIIDIIVKHIDKTQFIDLSEKCRHLAIARILQGKTIVEISGITKENPETIINELNKCIRELTKQLSHTMCTH
ncbi:MAG: tRNA(Met) cytidine acetyltransferase [Staphylothermus sp.]|nr:tRNA(Met) cytidine acetyltransferase [Staphylothermus sp.]